MTNNNETSDNKPLTFKLTTACTCVTYNEATDEWVPITDGMECGDCWSEEVEMFTEDVLDKWMEAHDLDFNDEIVISGHNMNWDKVSGVAESSPNRLVSALAINGDFTLNFTLDGKTLTCVRTSHDEVGASFTIIPVSELTRVYSERRDA